MRWFATAILIAGLGVGAFPASAQTLNDVGRAIQGQIQGNQDRGNQDRDRDAYERGRQDQLRAEDARRDEDRRREAWRREHPGRDYEEGRYDRRPDSDGYRRPGDYDRSQGDRYPAPVAPRY